VIPLLRLQQALTLVKLNRLDEAAQMFDRLALDESLFKDFSKSEVVDLRLAYATIMLYQSKLDKAKEQLDLATESIGAYPLGVRPNPSVVYLHIIRGFLSFQQGDLRLARNHLERTRFLIDTYFADSYQSEKMSTVGMLVMVEGICGNLDTAKSLLDELNALVDESGSPKDRFNAAFTASTLAPLVGDVGLLKRSILELEQSFGKNEAAGSLCHGYLLVARANLARMENKQAEASKLDARAAELLSEHNRNSQEFLIGALKNIETKKFVFNCN
jgi:tetratricopeptide (TPR) repeat protein